MPHPHEYTIGWLCAVGKESVAARVFLDEEHEKPDSLPAQDNNSYTLGRVGKHNVVIAALPQGEYGLVNAANAAKDMIRSFPNLRAGLMVGIGGGAPAPRHDIRLGDVVVSSAGSGNGGVYQFDFGKTIQNKAFVSTGFLNKPPTFIMTAVSTLETTYAINGHQLKEAVASVLDRNTRLRKEYQRPSLSTDRLYKANVLHSPEENCVLYCGDEASSLISRKTRSADEDDPAIHYGLIASSNQVMRDASIRDQLSAEKDVLCFEMEAAGLMNQFPFLIVRGICDYSDTHKNDLWRGYAAMTAAAYTKDLLREITPNKVEAQKKLGDVLNGIFSTLSSLDQNITYTRRHLDQKEALEILNWLIPTDYGPQQSDYLSRRQPGTGQWLLDSEEYQNWIKEPNKTLFCPGMPGAGKTILTSIVVEDLEKKFHNEITTAVAYVYCNYNRQSEQTPGNLLSSLLKQLARSQPSLPHSLKELHSQHDARGTRPSLEEVSKALESIIVQNSRVFIIVDALDECQVLDGYCTKFLSAIFNLQKKTGVNIFATSRSTPEIVNHFQDSLSIEIRATKEDISRYFQGRLLELPKIVIYQPMLQNEITTSITEAVKGMFLLAQLHFASLVGKDTPKAIRTALQNLATGSNAYDIAYEDAMKRIQGQLQEQAERAKQVLSWITCTKRPLTKLELQHALAVEIDEPELDKDNLPRIEDVVSVCAGLVTIDEESSTVRLVHYTTQEYFVRTQGKWFPDAELSITTICTTYLSYHDFASGYCKTDEEFEERLRLHPFYEYAARNWGHHGREIPACQNIISFLRKPAQVEASSQVLRAHRESRHPSYSQTAPRQMTGLHLAAEFGLDKIVEAILEDYNADVKDAHSRTPLSRAAENGHKTVVRLLLGAKQVDPDSTDNYGNTPLLQATLMGHEAVVKLLLTTQQVDPNLKNNYGDTPLLQAAAMGYEAVVKLLLTTRQVDPDLKDDYGNTPLLRAAERGHEAVVELLLATKQVDPNLKNNYGDTPLLQAATMGYEAVVKLLLATKRVDPNLKDNYGNLPLWRAAERGHKAIVRILLISEKVDLNIKDSKYKYGQTPLSLAVQKGHEAIVKILLASEKVDLNIKDNLGRTPLSFAVLKWHEAIVKILLASEKVDPNIKDDFGKTPLSLAVQIEHEAIVKILLTSEKVDPNSKDNSGRTPLSFAVLKWHEAIVKILLASEKVDLNIKDNLGRTPLSLAVQIEHEAIVKILLTSEKVDPNSKDNLGRTPLLFAVQIEHEAIVKMLLASEKVDPNIKDDLGKTPLSLAVQTEHEAIVKILLTSEKVDPNSKDSKYGQTPLSWAAEKGHEAVAMLLITTGRVDINAVDAFGATALQYAVFNNHDTVERLLLDNGASIPLDLYGLRQLFFDQLE